MEVYWEAMSVVLSMISNQNVVHFHKKQPQKMVAKYRHLLIHLIHAIMFSEVAAGVVHTLRSVFIGEGDHQVPKTR